LRESTIILVITGSNVFATLIPYAPTITTSSYINYPFYSKRTSQLGFGADNITDYFVKLLCEKGYDLTNSTARKFCQSLVKNHCFCVTDYASENEASEGKERVYAVVDLPNGTKMQIGKECFQAPEAFFRPNLIGYENSRIEEGVAGLITNFFIDPHRNNIDGYVDLLLVGETFPGFKDRLKMELRSDRFILHDLSDQAISDGALHITKAEAKTSGFPPPNKVLKRFRGGVR